MNEPYLYLLIKAVITLVFVLGLLAASLYAVRLYMGRKGMARNGGKPFVPVKVLTTSLLGQKKNLAIVEVAGEILVLGLTPNSISFLTKVEKAEAVEELRKLQGRKGLFNIFQGGF